MLSHDLDELDIKLNMYCGFEEFQSLPPFQLPLPPMVKPAQKKKRNALISGDPVCPVCKKQFCDQSTALRHLKNVHAPPYPCDYCGKMIKIGGRPDVLKNHLMRCPIFVRMYNNNVYDNAKQIAVQLYQKVKKERTRSFQVHDHTHDHDHEHHDFPESGFFSLPLLKE